MQDLALAQEAEETNELDHSTMQDKENQAGVLLQLEQKRLAFLQTSSSESSEQISYQKKLVESMELLYRKTVGELLYVTVHINDSDF